MRSDMFAYWLSRQDRPTLRSDNWADAEIEKLSNGNLIAVMVYGDGTKSFLALEELKARFNEEMMEMEQMTRSQW